mgnify:CR=1 FL=1
MNKKYYVYIVECSDGTYYTGYTTDISRRVDEHNYSTKKAAKYTRSRRPVRLLYSETYASVSEALKREYKIKKLSKKQKITLVNTNKDNM